MALHRDDLARSREEVLLALDAGRMAGDRQGVALFLGYLGGVAEAGGQFDEAETVYQDSVDSAREIDFPIAVAWVPSCRGTTASIRGLRGLSMTSVTVISPAPGS